MGTQEAVMSPMQLEPSQPKGEAWLSQRAKE